MCIKYGLGNIFNMFVFVNMQKIIFEYYDLFFFIEVNLNNIEIILL